MQGLVIGLFIIYLRGNTAQGFGFDLVQRNYYFAIKVLQDVREHERLAV